MIKESSWDFKYIILNHTSLTLIITLVHRPADNQKRIYFKCALLATRINKSHLKYNQNNN